MKKTWDEIKRQYPDEWVLISDYEQDKYGNFKAGVVVL